MKEFGILFLWIWSLLAIHAEIQSIKTDPICESARAALDTVNAQREEKHARKY